MIDTQRYDVIVIGAGPGGYVSAIKASQLGLKVAIIEKKWLGGVCLNVGCIPTKALLRNAELAHILRERKNEFGISFENLRVDYGAAVKRSRQVSKRLTKGVTFLMKKNKIDIYEGTGFILAKDKVQVTTEDGNIQDLYTRNIIVATGAHTFIIPGIEIDGESILTYSEAILQEQLPESVVIIGAGAIGMEFATVWNSYGSKVTIVEMLPNILPLEDEEVSVVLAKAYKKRGMEILTGTRVESVKKDGKGVLVQVSGEGGKTTLEAEQALVAIGFRPNLTDLGLEEVGVKTTKAGIAIDERMATNVPGIWAIGDVTGWLLLAHVASAQGVICAENIAGVETISLDYAMMPRAVYTSPQVAAFGLSEAEARKRAEERGSDIKVGRFNFMANGKALGLGDYTGFAKIITDVKEGEILGAAMVGPDVSELLPELTLAQRMGMTSEDIAHNVHAHPTLSEVLMEAAHAVKGQAVHM